MDRVGPDGQRLDARQRARYRPAEERVGAAVAAHLAAHPFATEGDLERVRASERAKAQHSVPYFDFTVSAASRLACCTPRCWWQRARPAPPGVTGRRGSWSATFPADVVGDGPGRHAGQPEGQAARPLGS
jgi:hypothetical protein